MKTLLQIQNEVAKEMFPDGGGWMTLTELGQLRYWPEVCRRAQLECARETLKEAAKEATASLVHEGPYADLFAVIDKNSILDEANIKLIQ